MLIDDFNAEESEQFLHDFYAVIIIHENACHKRMNNPSCNNLIITNVPNSFQNTSTLVTGLSDYLKLSVTVLKTFFQKNGP